MTDVIMYGPTPQCVHHHSVFSEDHFLGTQPLCRSALVNSSQCIPPYGPVDFLLVPVVPGQPFDSRHRLLREQISCHYTTTAPVKGVVTILQPLAYLPFKRDDTPFLPST